MERGEAQLQTDNNFVRETSPFCINSTPHLAASTPQIEYLLLEKRRIRWRARRASWSSGELRAHSGGSFEMSSHLETNEDAKKGRVMAW